MRWALGLLILASCDLQLDRTTRLPPELERQLGQERQALLGDSGNSERYLRVGQLYLEGKQFFEAAEYLSRGAELSPNNPKILGPLAETYLELGYIIPMVDKLKACFAVNPAEPGCLFAFALLLERDGSTGARQEAIRTWNRFLMAAPNHPKVAYAKSSLDQLLAQEAAQQAQHPASAPANPPSDPHGQPPASPPANPAANLPPNHPPTDPEKRPIPGHEKGTGGEVGELNPFGQAIMEAMAAVEKNDAKGAETAFRKALAIHPDDASALAGLAEALFAQNKVAEASTTADKAYKLDNTDPQVRWVFGLVMLRNTQRANEGLAAWEALLKDNPEYGDQLKLRERIDAARKFLAPGGHGQP